MRLCHIVPSLEERHGGPSKSVRALANHLATPEHDVALLATAEAGFPSASGTGDRATIRIFPRVMPRWLCRSPELRRHLVTVSLDCIHHHSLWLLTLRYAAAAAARQDIPLVISPRGMMSDWAWQHHRWRKQLASWLVHPGAMRGAAGWHATSTQEADDIRARGFRQPVCVAPNGVRIPDNEELTAARSEWHELMPAIRSRPVALFYSRLHRKKRVCELIDLWLATQRGDWLLLIAGMAEEISVAELTAEITARGATDRIVVMNSTGHAPPYAAATLFLLPSHSENFGLVIAEALAAGLPVLVTDTTPWQDLARRQAGWCVPWTDYPGALSRALSESPDQLATLGRQGRAWMERDYSWARAAALLRDFYASLHHGHR